MSTRKITPKSLFKGRSGGLKDVPYPISRATVVCFFSLIEQINKLNIYFPSKSVLQDRPAAQGYQGCQAVSWTLCVQRCHRDGERFRRTLGSGIFGSRSCLLSDQNPHVVLGSPVQSGFLAYLAKTGTET